MQHGGPDDPFLTLDDAMEAIGRSPNATLVLMPGVYPQLLIANPPTHLTVQAMWLNGTDEVVLRPRLGHVGSTLRICGAKDCLVKGLRIEVCSPGGRLCRSWDADPPPLPPQGASRTRTPPVTAPPPPKKTMALCQPPPRGALGQPLVGAGGPNPRGRSPRGMLWIESDQQVLYSKPWPKRPRRTPRLRPSTNAQQPGAASPRPGLLARLVFPWSTGAGGEPLDSHGPNHIPSDVVDQPAYEKATGAFGGYVGCDMPLGFLGGDFFWCEVHIPLLCQPHLAPQNGLTVPCFHPHKTWMRGKVALIRGATKV